MEEEAALGRGKRLRKAVSYREAYAPHPSETLSEVVFFNLLTSMRPFSSLFNVLNSVNDISNKYIITIRNVVSCENMYLIIYFF